ncbi:MAG TPA: alpha/beta fold hydrolase [Chitinophagales bacterium]|nr:alpha/beta fold hydrolase [Chitinophagales bacterium]HMW11899.1 alpha/beta fold hydrolase [Chitinophagales bacterium]HMX59525.1 alpha/beta fold hydrolase [Chitinophagales bacterium]HMY23131.1 alpha/beta fold hydrolase [Chitinophagales bacterium]HMZ32986.1 alpha/beta fold hydrolase [Chitinophagales bacterium]
MLLQRAIIFHPKKLPTHHEYKSKYAYTEHFYEFNISNENFIINAVHLAAPNSKGFVFFLHGTTNHIQYHLPKTEFFIENNYDVFLMDYPTYGKSKGKLTEDLLHKVVALTYAKAIEQATSTENIILLGRSLGTALASRLAIDVQPRSLILVSPYYSMPDLFNSKLGLFPFKKLKFKLENFSAIPKVHCNTYIFHGNADKLIPIRLSQKLIPLLKSADHYFEIDGANHFNVHQMETFKEKLKQILA